MSKVTETVTALAAPVAEKLGLELWDVDYIREAGEISPTIDSTWSIKLPE